MSKCYTIFEMGTFKAYNLEFSYGPLQSLLSPVVVVINEHHEIVYTEQIPEIVDEADYKATLEAITNA